MQIFILLASMTRELLLSN